MNTQAISSNASVFKSRLLKPPTLILEEVDLTLLKTEALEDIACVFIQTPPPSGTPSNLEGEFLFSFHSFF